MPSSGFLGKDNALITVAVFVFPVVAGKTSRAEAESANEDTVSHDVANTNVIGSVTGNVNVGYVKLNVVGSVQLPVGYGIRSLGIIETGGPAQGGVVPVFWFPFLVNTNLGIIDGFVQDWFSVALGTSSVATGYGSLVRLGQQGKQIHTPKAGSGEALRFGFNTAHLGIPVAGARLVWMSWFDTALWEGFLLLQFHILFGLGISNGRNALAMAEIVFGQRYEYIRIRHPQKGDLVLETTWLWRPDSSCVRRLRTPIWRERFGWRMMGPVW